MTSVKNNLTIEYEKSKHTYIKKNHTAFELMIFLLLFGGLWFLISLGWKYLPIRDVVVVPALVTIVIMFLLLLRALEKIEIEVNSDEITLKKTPLGYFRIKNISLSDIEEFFMSPSYFGKHSLRLKMKKGDALTLINNAGTWAEVGALKNELNKSLKYFNSQKHLN